MQAPLRARAFGLLAAILVVGLSAVALPAHAATGDIEVRVAAQRLADGRTEFAIQERRDAEEWGERRLPRSRFFPSGASAGRWLASSPLTVGLPGVGRIEVRVATQLLSDGRMEFAIQERRKGEEWAERRLPQSRFLPAQPAVGRWLASSPLAASLPDAGRDVALVEVRIATQLLSDGRMEFAIQERREGEEWAERRLPQSRFFPADAEVDRWLASSPLTVSVERAAGVVEIRVAAQRLADGRTGFALQEREVDGAWGPRRLPRSRFFPAGAAVGRWLASSALTVSVAASDSPPEMTTTTSSSTAAVVPFSLRDFTNGRWLQQRDPQLASSIGRLSWTQDGVDETEAGVVQDLLYIAATSRSVASTVVSLGWVQDGIGDAEAEVVQDLLYIAATSRSVASTVVSLGWVQDGIGDAEAEAINWLNNVGSAQVAASVVALGWVRDGMSAAEVKAIEYLSHTANVDLAVARFVLALNWVQNGISELEADVVEEIYYLTYGHPRQALRVVGMRFLESVEPPDLPALDALSNLSSFRPEDFETVMSHPTVRDGITDELAPVVATLDGVARTNPRLIEVLLDPEETSLERRTVVLPLSGEVMLSILRTSPGSARSMDLLERSVRQVESFMELPLPGNFVGLLFEDAVLPGFPGVHFGTHMAILPEYDADDGNHEAESFGRIIAHEVAHYYWRGNSTWVDEGIANIIASVSENARTGQPVQPANSPCGYVRTIAELEDLGVTTADGPNSAFICSYSLGERLFLDLYRRLGEDAFRRGLRDLYLLSASKGEEKVRGDASVGIGDVRAAFRGAEGVDDSTVAAVAARWYDGTEPYDTSALSTGRPNPLLRTVDGRLHLAYLAGAHEGPPISTISASAIGDGLWLLLRWTYTVGSSMDVPLEIVHYYEDGFEFGRRTVSFTADTRHNDSLWSWWLPVGHSSDVRWAPGEYRLHVYNEGRKLVELEYVVNR